MTEAQKKAIKKYREKLNRLTLEFSPAESDLWEVIAAQKDGKRTFVKNLIKQAIKESEPMNELKITKKTLEALLENPTLDETNATSLKTALRVVDAEIEQL